MKQFAIAMMVRSFDTATPLLAFYENAIRFGHKPARFIIGWQDSLSEAALSALSCKLPVTCVALRHPKPELDALRQKGLSEAQVNAIWHCDYADVTQPMPYGASRTLLLIAAIEAGVDQLFFVDDDTHPQRLLSDGTIETVDFFKYHLVALAQSGIAAATSDYTGYDIVPNLPIEAPARFLEGLQKPFVMGKTLVASQSIGRQEQTTTKLLGGNLSLNLEAFTELLPFYSTVLKHRGRTYLGRGEDTLLGLSISKSQNWQALDIDLRIFHNAFKDYPRQPNLMASPQDRERFFYACVGWIARNPLLNWLKGDDWQLLWEAQYDCLSETAMQMSEALKDPRFSQLPEFMTCAKAQFSQQQEAYEAFVEAWTMYKGGGR